jgi:hypothetical protein
MNSKRKKSPLKPKLDALTTVDSQSIAVGPPYPGAVQKSWALSGRSWRLAGPVKCFHIQAPRVCMLARVTGTSAFGSSCPLPGS